MGNKSSNLLVGDESMDTMDQLERICEELEAPSDDHCLRVLIEPTIIVTSKNPHVLLQIAEWHKHETNCIAVNLKISSTKRKEYVFKISLTNNNINNEIWKMQLIEYIKDKTLYKLNCVTNCGESSFISWSCNKNNETKCERS